MLVHDLARAWAKLPQVVASLLAEVVSTRDVAAVISRELDALTRHAAVIAEARMRDTRQGDPLCPYARPRRDRGAGYGAENTMTLTGSNTQLRPATVASALGETIQLQVMSGCGQTGHHKPEFGQMRPQGVDDLGCAGISAHRACDAASTASAVRPIHSFPVYQHGPAGTFAVLGVHPVVLPAPVRQAVT